MIKRLQDTQAKILCSQWTLKSIKMAVDITKSTSQMSSHLIHPEDIKNISKTSFNRVIWMATADKWQWYPKILQSKPSQLLSMLIQLSREFCRSKWLKQWIINTIIVILRLTLNQLQTNRNCHRLQRRDQALGKLLITCLFRINCKIIRCSRLLTIQIIQSSNNSSLEVVGLPSMTLGQSFAVVWVGLTLTMASSRRTSIRCSHLEVQDS